MRIMNELRLTTAEWTEAHNSWKTAQGQLNQLCVRDAQGRQTALTGLNFHFGQ